MPYPSEPLIVRGMEGLLRDNPVSIKVDDQGRPLSWSMIPKSPADDLNAGSNFKINSFEEVVKEVVEELPPAGPGEVQVGEGCGPRVETIVVMTVNCG